MNFLRLQRIRSLSWNVILAPVWSHAASAVFVAAFWPVLPFTKWHAECYTV